MAETKNGSVGPFRLGPFRVHSTNNVADLTNDLNRQLGLITTYLNNRMGYAGPVTIANQVDVQGNPVLNVGTSDLPHSVATVAQVQTLQATLAAVQQALATLAAQVAALDDGQDAVQAPPAVADTSDIGAYTGKFARQDHTHAGVNLSGAQTVTGLKTFSRGSGQVPFAVGSGAAKVVGLDADRLDGHDSPYFATAADLAALSAAVDDLTVDVADLMLGRWEPLIGGEPHAPELIFAGGKLIWEFRPITEDGG